MHSVEQSLYNEIVFTLHSSDAHLIACRRVLGAATAILQRYQNMLTQAFWKRFDTVSTRVYGQKVNMSTELASRAHPVVFRNMASAHPLTATEVSANTWAFCAVEVRGLHFPFGEAVPLTLLSLHGQT